MNAFWDWFNVERTAVLVATFALLGVFYSAAQARAAKKQAIAAEDQAATSKESADAAKLQARHAETQVELARKQTDLLLRQIEQGEVAAAETRRAQRDALQPVVIVDITPGVNDPSVFVLTVANTGSSVARDVRIEAPAELLRSDGTKMHEWPVFTKGVKTMPPGHRMQFFFDVGFSGSGAGFLWITPSSSTATDRSGLHLRPHMSSTLSPSKARGLRLRPWVRWSSRSSN